jgi:hypothetical protein
MCRVQIPPLASFGSRDRALSEDGWKSARISTRCSCQHPGSKGGVSGFHRGSSTESTSLLLGQDGGKVRVPSMNLSIILFNKLTMFHCEDMC